MNVADAVGIAPADDQDAVAECEALIVIFETVNVCRGHEESY